MTFIPSLTFTDYEWFPWSICNGCGMPARNAYPSGHLVPSPLIGLACAPIVETRFLELAMFLIDFSPPIPLEYPLVLSRFYFCRSTYHVFLVWKKCFHGDFILKRSKTFLIQRLIYLYDISCSRPLLKKKNWMHKLTYKQSVLWLVDGLFTKISKVGSKQKRSTEGCSKFKSPETRQVQERLVSTLEHMLPKWERTRCPEE